MRAGEALWVELGMGADEMGDFRAWCRDHNAMARFHHFVRRWRECGIMVGEDPASLSRQLLARVDRDRGAHRLFREGSDDPLQDIVDYLDHGELLTRQADADERVERVDWRNWEDGALGRCPGCVVVDGDPAESSERVLSLLLPLTRVCVRFRVIDRDIVTQLKWEKGRDLALRQFLERFPTDRERIFEVLGAHGETEGDTSRATVDKGRTRIMAIGEQLRSWRALAHLKPGDPFLRKCHDRFISFLGSSSADRGPSCQVGIGIGAALAGRTHPVTLSRVSPDAFRDIWWGLMRIPDRDAA